VVDEPRVQITKAQHVFPRSCLVHFRDASGKLEIGDLKTGKVTRVGLDRPPFVTERSWDQRTESGPMHEVETDFGRVVAPIRKGQVLGLGAEHHRAVTAMYALWMLRAHRAREPIPDIKLNVQVEQRAEHTAAVVDQLEAHGIITVAPDGSVPGRQLAGPQLQLDFDRALNHLAGVTWGVVRAAEGAGEFCIPDSPERVLYLPLTPRIALASNWPDGEVGRADVSSFNTAAFQHAKAFVAARSVSACPWWSCRLAEI
jgi:hypothetical protein